MDLDDARVNHFPAEFFFGAGNRKNLGPLDTHGVLEVDRMQVPMLFLGHVLKDLIMQTLIEDKEGYFLAFEKQLQVTKVFVKDASYFRKPRIKSKGLSCFKVLCRYVFIFSNFMMSTNYA